MSPAGGMDSAHPPAQHADPSGLHMPIVVSPPTQPPATSTQDRDGVSGLGSTSPEVTRH